MTEKDTRQLNPLVMAFVGDSVFTLFVRTKLACASHTKAGGLHKEANKFVSAPAQSYKRATSLEAVFGYLSLSEQNERLEFLLETAYAINEKRTKQEQTETGDKKAD